MKYKIVKSIVYGSLVGWSITAFIPGDLGLTLSVCAGAVVGVLVAMEFL